MGKQRKIERACDFCGTVYMAGISDLARGKHLTCSLVCGQRNRPPMPKRPVATDDELWARIRARITVTPTGCWEWGGKLDRDGYGFIGVKDVRWRVHRLAYKLHTGIEPTADQHVCHRCDNPPCCNPDHLFLGTAADNAADRKAKGRTRYVLPPPARGEANHAAKLTDDQVREIRDSTGPRTEIAIQFGVHPEYVTALRARKGRAARL